MTAAVQPSVGVTSAALPPRRQQLTEAAQAFEAIFLRQMLGAMRAAKLTDDPLSNAASDQFREMSDARLADSLSQQGFGIAEMLLQQFAPEGPDNG
ncbi:MAG: rod-binding protein [Sphingopyxis sp.]